MGALLAFDDRQRQTLAYTQLPEAHWLLAIILFIIVGASLLAGIHLAFTALQALGLLLDARCGKGAAAFIGGRDLPRTKRLWVGPRHPAAVGNNGIHGLTDCRTLSRRSAVRRCCCRCLRQRS